MRRSIHWVFAMAGVFYIAPVAHAQISQLPAEFGYPKKIEWQKEQGSPAVWSDGRPNMCTSNEQTLVAFSRTYRRLNISDPLQMFGMIQYDGADGFFADPITLHYQHHLVGAPDVFGEYTVVDLQDCVNPNFGYMPNVCVSYDWRIRSFHLPTGLEYDLSGMGISTGSPPYLNFRPSIGESYVAWQTNPCNGCNNSGYFTSGVSYNVPNGSVASREEVFLGSDWYLEFPSVWSDFIVYEAVHSVASVPAEIGIGVFEISSHASFEFTDSYPGPEFRYAPHVAEGRIVYHYRDLRNTQASISELRYMDIHALGVEVTPSFVGKLSCAKMTGPRVGGKDGRFIVFTGVDCDGLPTYSLLLGDDHTGEVYFVDRLENEPNTGDHRPPYDIHGNVVVYQAVRPDRFLEYDVESNAIVVYAFDESQL